MPEEHSLFGVLENIYQSHLALEAAPLNLHEGALVHRDMGESVYGALGACGKGTGHVNQGLAGLEGLL